MLTIDGFSLTIEKIPPLFPVRDVSMTINANEIVAVIGESGCGKSLTAMAIIGLDRSETYRYGGSINFDGLELLGLSDRLLNEIRGKRISYISQDPMDALNPSLRIGYQILEAYKIHHRINRKEGRQKVLDLLVKVGIDDSDRVYKSYPHQLSGGMQQRVCIAMAIICQPALIIADEPTTALDRMTEKKILALLKSLQEIYGLSILLISHDIQVVRSFAHRVLVMYAGQVVECLDLSRDKFTHPYSQDLLRCLPKPSDKNSDLYAIEGSVYEINANGDHCLYADRCGSRMSRCTEHQPQLKSLDEAHEVRCYYYEK